MNGRYLKGFVLIIFTLIIACVRTQPPGLQASAGAAVELDEPEQMKVIAITFDDGPRWSTTTRLLDGLALMEVPATFFLVGSRIPGNEELIQRMQREGHQIGVHSYDHILMTDLSKAAYTYQETYPQDMLTEILGEGDYWLRPPYGLLDSGIRRWSTTPIILWSIDPEDWRDQDFQRMVNHICARAGSGDIILLHDLFDSSVDVALEVVRRLLDEGFVFLTVKDLMQYQGVTPQKGQAYYQIGYANDQG